MYFSMPKYKLYYLPIRGRGEPIRMMFAISGVVFEDIRIPWDKWPDVKKTTPFGHVPVLEVDGKPIPQLLAILRYLAKEFGMYGRDPLEQAMIDAVAEQHVDFGFDYGPWHQVNVGYVPGDKDFLYEEVFLPARAKHFPIFQKLLIDNPSGWLIGDSITFVDLLVATRMELLESVVPDKAALFDGFLELKSHKEKVYSHPKLQHHLASRPNDRY